MTIVYIVGILAVCVTLLLTVAMIVREVEWRKLDSRFHEIQKDFADNDPAIRAVAALQLGEIAIKYCPREGTRTVTDDYPFLQRAASQFAVALNLETDIQVRIALAEAIHTLLCVAGYKTGGLPKECLADTFLHANQTALENYIKSLARYLVSQPNQESLAIIEKCALVSLFCGDDIRLNREIVRTLCETERFKAEIEVLYEISLTLEDTHDQSNKNAGLLADVQDVASRLISTRDAFAFSLMILKERQNSHFKRQFLAGADLKWARLRYSNLEGAFLIGTNLSSANLSAVNLDHAFLNFADMSYAYLSQASLTNANMQGAKFDEASLPFVQLTSAKVAKSNLNDALSVSANWKEADFFIENKKDEVLYQRMIEKFSDVPNSYEEEYRYWEENKENWRTTND